MAEHNDLGRDGEEAAARYLMFHDYSILDRNWRAGNLEIDIVAQKKGVLVFVEVKTQETDVFLEPEDRLRKTPPLGKGRKRLYTFSRHRPADKVRCDKCGRAWSAFQHTSYRKRVRRKFRHAP